MAEILPGNGLRSTLAAGITAGATSLQIAAADAPHWPTGGEYRAVLCTDPATGPYELVRVTGGQGTATLTVTRAVEKFGNSQTAYAWSTGTSISAVVTKDTLQLAAGITIPFSQHLTFAADEFYNIGESPGNKPYHIYVGSLDIYGQSILSSGSMTIGAAGFITFETGSIPHWFIDSVGNFQASTDNTYDIGGPSNRPRDLYVGNVSIGSTWGVSSSSVLWLNAGTNIEFAAGGGTSYWLIDSSGTFKTMTDNTVDIGAPGANRPRNVYVAGVVDTNTVGPSSGVGHLYLQTHGWPQWLVDGANGHLLAFSDNAQDIGAPGANRPANIYVGDVAIGGSIVSGTGLLSLNAAAGPLTFETGSTTRWYINSDGHLLANVDNIYDVGAYTTLIGVMLEDTPYAVYRFGEASGSTAEDSSGNARSGLYGGDVTYGQAGAPIGDSDTAVKFNGGEGQGSMAVSNANLPSSIFEGNFTISIWIRPTSSTLEYITKRNGLTTPGFYWRFGTGSILFSQLAGSTNYNVAATNPLILDTWNHIAITKSGTTVTHYLNGATNGTGSVTGTVNANTSDSFNVGYNSDLEVGGSGHSVDELAVYNTELSAQRISTYYSVGSTALNNVRPRTVYVGTSVITPAITGANTLHMRNGTSAQTLRIYTTYTDASNYEALEISASFVPSIFTRNAGTGTAKNLRLGTGGTVRWEIDTTGNLFPYTTNAFNLGTDSLRVREMFLYRQNGVETTKPTNPAAGRRNLYAKTDGWYDLNSAGVETRLSGSSADREEFLPASGTTITLTTTPTEILMVMRGGVVQSETDGDYSISGNTLTFTDAFDGTDRVVVSYVTGAVGAVGPPGPSSSVHEEFLPVNGATTVTLTQTPIQLLMVSRAGVVQSAADGNYTVAGTTITFTDALNGAERVIVDYSTSSYTPTLPINGGTGISDQSITNIKLASDTARANLLTNGGFEIWQRGNGPFTTNGAMTADTWQAAFTGTFSVTKDTANADGVGSCAAVVCSGTATPDNRVIQSFNMNLERAGLLGKTVTFSARVKCSTASAVRLGANLYAGSNNYQYGAYHSGSGAYETLMFTVTIATNVTYFQPGLFFTVAGGVTAYLDNAMLVVGSVAADYVPLHPADDLARCFRYYEVCAGSPAIISGIATANGQSIFTPIPYGVKKAVTPSVTLSNFSNLNAGNCSINTHDAWGIRVGVISTAAGSFYSAFSYTSEANP